MLPQVYIRHNNTLRFKHNGHSLMGVRHTHHVHLRFGGYNKLQLCYTIYDREKVPVYRYTHINNQ